MDHDIKITITSTTTTNNNNFVVIKSNGNLYLRVNNKCKSLTVVLSRRCLNGSIIQFELAGELAQMSLSAG